MPDVSDVAESGAQRFGDVEDNAGIAPLAFATEALSRNAGAFARLYEPAGGTRQPRASAPRGDTPPTELSGLIAALLASFDSNQGTPDATDPAARPLRRMPLDDRDHASRGANRPTSPSEESSPPARERPFAPARSFALSLALLAGEEHNGAADADGSQAPFAGRRSRAASLPRGLFAHLPPEQLAEGASDLLDGPSLEARRGHDRQQRQLETLLRIERLLDETVRLLRQPRAAVFAADHTGVP